MVSEMGRIFIGITFIIFIVSGCQPDEIGEVLIIEHDEIKDNNIEEVLNDHNNIKNLDGLNTFVENVNNQKEAVINYVQYGTERQRGIRTLTSENGNVSVIHSVDGEFIEDLKQDIERYSKGAVLSSSEVEKSLEEFETFIEIETDDYTYDNNLVAGIVSSLNYQII